MQLAIEICYSEADSQAAIAHWEKLKWQFIGAAATPYSGVNIYERKGEIRNQLKEALHGDAFVLYFSKA